LIKRNSWLSYRISFFIVAVISVVVTAEAQIPAATSARSIPTSIDESDALISQVIAKAEEHFRKGKLNLEENKRAQARDQFDKSIDTVLESGIDVRRNQRLEIFYWTLVDRIYREEVPLQLDVPSVAPAQFAAQNQKAAKPQNTQTGFRFPFQILH
jgi:hypothetical protein